jgi:hypothetical protein
MLLRVALVRIDGSEERRFLQEPQGVTSQKTPFFIVTAVETSNLTYKMIVEEVFPNGRSQISNY